MLPLQLQQRRDVSCCWSLGDRGRGVCERSCNLGIERFAAVFLQSGSFNQNQLSKAFLFMRGAVDKLQVRAVIAVITIRDSRPEDGGRAVEIWRKAVDATHDFLSPEDRLAIGEMVCGFLPQAALKLAVDGNDYPLAFMLIEDGHMQALFVDPNCRGAGVGAALVLHGLGLHPRMTTDVNEQNAQAVGFYEKMGFKRTGRSPFDDQGRPYPLIHLEYQAGLSAAAVKAQLPSSK